MRALLRLQSIDPGFKSESVLTLRTALTTTRYDTVARRAAFYREVLARVREIPASRARPTFISSNCRSRRHLAGDS